MEDESADNGDRHWETDTYMEMQNKLNKAHAWLWALRVDGAMASAMKILVESNREFKLCIGSTFAAEHRRLNSWKRKRERESARTL